MYDLSAIVKFSNSVPSPASLRERERVRAVRIGRKWDINRKY
jgi:hypothetical protein